MSNFTEALQRSGSRPNQFESVAIGDYRLSIQASEFHYCGPRESGLHPSDYYEFELAVFKGKDWLTWHEVSEVFGIDLSEWAECAEDRNNAAPVYAWVPRQTVQELYDAMIARCTPEQAEAAPQ